jgi:hypothetical protein
MRQFLLVYDQLAGKLLEMREFSEAERSFALEERFRVEREFAMRSQVEVILLGANSREDLEKTHARYFRSVGELAAGD